MADEQQPGFFQRFRVPIIVGVVVLGAVGYFLFPKEAPKKRSSVTMVNIMPPLPPPPPPPTPPPTPPPQEPPPEPETKQQDFQPEDKPEPKPEPPAPEPEAAPPLGSNIQGDGPPDGFGLSGKGNGLIGGTGKGSGKGGASKWGWYAGKVQTSVVQALRSNRRTRSAALDIKVRLWADSTGRVTRVALVGSSGDAALDRAIQNEILTGLQLPEPPPAEMPMPIVMRISAQRPN